MAKTRVSQLSEANKAVIAICEKSGLDRMELARRGGVTYVQLGNWCTGRIEPKFSQVQAFACNLGIKAKVVLNKLPNLAKEK